MSGMWKESIFGHECVFSVVVKNTSKGRALVKRIADHAGCGFVWEGPAGLCTNRVYLLGSYTAFMYWKWKLVDRDQDISWCGRELYWFEHYLERENVPPCVCDSSRGVSRLTMKKEEEEEE